MKVVTEMKKFFILVLGLIILTGCQLKNSGTQSDDLTVKKIRANRNNVPTIRYIERITAEKHTNDISMIYFIDSDGNRCISSNSEIIAMNNIELTEKYGSGELKKYEGEQSEGYMIQKNYFDKEKLADTYKLICDAVEFNDYKIVYPEMLPDVEASLKSVDAMYYTTDNELKCIQIYLNVCLTGIYSNCESATEAYEWYKNASKKN